MAGGTSQVDSKGLFPQQTGGRRTVGSHEGPTHATPASCRNRLHPDQRLSHCFYRERNKVLCSEESGRTLVVNPSQLLFVWVLWAEMRQEMRWCMSHLGIVEAVEESALVSRFIIKTNKGKYSLKKQQKSQLRIRGWSHLITPVCFHQPAKT